MVFRDFSKAFERFIRTAPATLQLSNDFLLVLTKFSCVLRSTFDAHECSNLVLIVVVRVLFKGPSAISLILRLLKFVPLFATL